MRQHAANLWNLLNVEVLQEDSQTLTCSLYCKFTGTVDLVKWEPYKKLKKLSLEILCMVTSINMI